MSSFAYRITVSPDVIHQEVLLGESLLMDTRTLAYFALDEFGTRLWRELARSKDAAEVVQRLADSGDLPREAVEKKFELIINGLQNSRIIQIEQ